MQFIFDNHIHLQPSGRNIDAVRAFEKAGGTHIVLVNLPFKEISIEPKEYFCQQYEITIKLANQIETDTKVKVFVALGPYPTTIVSLSKIISLEESKEFMFRGMELAGQYVLEGKAIAIGEIGRPHFPVSKEIWEASNEIIRYGMQIAKECSCAIILHTESANTQTFEEFAKIADSVGLERNKVVKHFSPPIIKQEENFGLFPSIVSKRENIIKAISQGNRFLMETDYLDDLNRPGVVLGPATVPKITKEFLREGLFTEEDVWKIHKENPEEVYGAKII